MDMTDKQIYKAYRRYILQNESEHDICSEYGIDGGDLLSLFAKKMLLHKRDILNLQGKLLSVKEGSWRNTAVGKHLRKIFPKHTDNLKTLQFTMWRVEKFSKDRLGL